MTRVAAVILAAGAGTRMGTPKAELVVAGQRLLDGAVARARSAGCAPVVAVVRAGTTAADAEVVVNPEPGRGLRSSLALGIDAVAGADAVAVLLADQPGIEEVAIREVCRAWAPGRIAVARYRAGRGHPTVMAPALWREAIAVASADEGARALLAARPDLVDEVPVAGDPTDLDTPADLRRWQG